MARHPIAAGDGVDARGTATRPQSTGQTGSWRAAYVRRAAWIDLLCGVLAVGVGFLVRFGNNSPADQAATSAVVIAIAFPLAWVASMLLGRTYEPRFLFNGPEEYRRVILAATVLVAAVGTLSWALKLEVARGLVVATLPLATLLALLARHLHRRWLHRQRSRGAHQQATLIVGHRNGVAALHEQIRREGYQGLTVVGCCLPEGEGSELPATFDGLPVLGSTSQVAEVVGRAGVDTVALLPSPELDGPALRRLGWQLEKTNAELLLAPAITEVVGTRVQIRPMCGLPLMHMERPELTGVRRLAKETFDRSAAAAAVLVMLPLLLAVTVAVKVSSPGPVLFRQERVGRDGRSFGMLKFRSMVDGADRLAPPPTGHDGNGVLFKLRQDPRVTPVGKLLRRYSIDELPQLLNVLRGEMSLVGPRPPLPSEVELYGFDMHRRFLVKPGLTGLWQVSGRSDLSWDDSVRIDIRYVENWSLAFDLHILWKTVGAVLRGSGAY